MKECKSLIELRIWLISRLVKLFGNNGRNLIKFFLVLSTLLATSACGSTAMGNLDATPLRNLSFYTLELRDGTIPDYVIGLLENSSTDLFSTITLEAAGTILGSKRYVAAIQYKEPMGIWKTIPEFVPIDFQYDTSFELNVADINPSSTALRVAIWEAGQTSVPPVFASKKTRLRVWNIELYASTFRALRQELNTDVDSRWEATKLDCMENIKELGENEEAGLKCMKLYSNYYEESFTAYDDFYTNIYSLGVPQSLENQFTSYIQSALDLYEYFYTENYEYCLQSIYTFENLAQCAGVNDSKSSAHNTLQLRLRSALNELAAQFNKLGASNFKFSDGK